MAASRSVSRLLCAALVLSVACAAESSETAQDSFAPRAQEAASAGSDARTNAVIADAYAALTAGEHARVGEIIRAVDARVAAAPDDGRASFYAGTMRLWRMIESGAAVTGITGADPTDPILALGRLERARALLPDDFRATGFLGVIQVSVGRVLASKAQMDAGFATLDRAIEQDPAYGYFLRASATMGFPRSDPRSEITLQDLVKLAEVCRYPVGDDEVAHRYPSDAEAEEVSRSRVCLNDGMVPHVWEGVFVAFGDTALRSGWSAARARALYRSARTAPNYETWPFAEQLDARIASADERAALYADTNAANDPLVWGNTRYNCVGCHQTATNTR